MTNCYKCASELENLGPGAVSRSATCPSCSAYVRCCRNCQHFRAPNDCAEPHAEWVSNREAGNFCEWFSMSKSQAESGSEGEKPNGDDAFDALFKK